MAWICSNLHLPCTNLLAADGSTGNAWVEEPLLPAYLGGSHATAVELQPRGAGAHCKRTLAPCILRWGYTLVVGTSITIYKRILPLASPCSRACTVLLGPRQSRITANVGGLSRRRHCWT